MSCLNCHTPCLSRCGKCVRAYYCSQVCQRSHWLDHKLTCHVDIPTSFLLLVNLYIEFDPNYKWIFLSPVTHYIKINGSYRALSVFNTKSFKHYCVICYQPITYSGPLSEVRFDLSYKGHIIICYRCVFCNKGNKLICGVTFMDTQVCFSKKYYYFFLYLEQLGIYIPQDIKQLLLNLMLWIKCC